MKYGLFVLLLGLVSLYTQAQSPDTVRAGFVASVSEVALGQPFTLTVFAELPANAELISWVSLEDNDTLQVLGTEEHTTQRIDNHMRYEQTFRVVLWRVGMFLTPEAFVTYRHNGSTRTLPVGSASVFVPSLVTSESTLKPFAPTIDLPLTPIYLYGSLAIGMLAIVGTFVWLLRRRQSVPPTLDIIASTQRQLNALKQQDLPSNTLVLYASALLRSALHQLNIANALKLTTQELIALLREQSQLPTSLINALAWLLEQADLVKFSNISLDIAITRYLNACSRWLDDLNRFQQEAVV